jgi:xanthine/uracil permease
MQFTFYDFIGSVGVGLIVLTYILLQTEKIRSENPTYSVLNGLGAGLIVISLFFDFNFSAFVVESLWVLISIYGIGKYFFKGKRVKSEKVKK